MYLFIDIKRKTRKKICGHLTKKKKDDEEEGELEGLTPFKC